jgi:hypothetical protein
MKKEPTMNEDIAKYPVFILHNKELIPANWITSTANYNHYVFNLHHFVRQTLRRTNPKFYERVEHLQKLILMPKQMNNDLENMGADKFFETHKIEKHKLVFERKLWRAGYYDSINNE